MSGEREPYRFDRSQELFARAAAVIPRGIYGHLSPVLTVPGSFPYFAARASGCRYTDVDGNEFIDYMCGYGPIVLGYRHPAVEQAVADQVAALDCANHPAPVMVELAELMVELIPAADWVVFVKNGGDATTFSLLVARAHTGRKKIIRVRGHYHGVASWCTSLGHGGITPEDHLNLLLVEWNDLDGLQALARRHRGEIAGFIATPYHHATFADQVMPAPGYWQGVVELCRTEGILLIVDDVRAGFRLHLGGSAEHFGFCPDLTCFGKAMGNGHPISACVGRRELMAAASRVFYTGSYWFAAAPMAAAVTTLKELRDTDALARMRAAGRELAAGLREMGVRHGMEVTVSGPEAMPYLRFTADRDLYLTQIFCAEVTRRGSFFHPHHNWFLCAAHDRGDVAETLTHAEEGFKAVRCSYARHARQ